MHHGEMRALLLVGILALSFGCGGDDDTGADAGADAGDERAEALAYCMALGDLPGSDVADEDCCFVDEFSGTERNCDTNESGTFVDDGVDGCVYSSEELFPHPDGDYIRCAFTACESCAK